MATRNVDGTLMRYHPRLSLSERIDLYKMKEDEPIVKSTIECARMREYSESIIKKHDHLTTFIVFNRSLCFGIKGTDETIKAHISRSAACVMVNADAAALQNIEFIKNNSYSPDTKHHADLVEKKATSKLAKARKGMNDMPKTPLYTFLYEQQSNSPKITFPSPLVIKKGCLVTTKDHEIGDIIAMEQPFFGASFCDSANMNCANCMKFSMFTLIPCDGCTTTMFCSEECKKEATKGYHQYECEVIDRVALFFREFYKVLMVFRQLFKALAICGGSAAELKELLTTDNSRNVLDFDYDSEMFRSDPKQHLVASFASNINLLPWSKSRKKEEKLMFSKFLRIFPKLRRTYQNAEEKKFVLTFLVTQSRFAFSTDFEYGAEIEKWVGGVYPLRSYMKSSCLPNVVGYIYDRCSVVYIAQERLKAGCLVTVQHSALMVEDWFYKRGEHFLKTFATNCTCLACVRNYRPVLEIKDLEEMKSLSNVFREKLGFARALGAEQTLLNNYYKDLQQIWKREPNMEMVKKWFGMSIYNVSQSATLNITRHLTDLGDKID